MSKQSILPWRATGMSLGVALLLSVLAWAGFGQSALAQSDQPLDALVSITVNTSDPAINDNGACSIIEAIVNANDDAQIYDDCAAGSGNDTISLPNDALMIFTATHNLLDGGNALPVITSTMTIVGNGSTLVRNNGPIPLFRFFEVTASGNLSLTDLALRNGRAGLNGTSVLVFGGGAIFNQGTLSVRDSNLSFNRASLGGAIYSIPVTGSLSLNNTTFSSNVADTTGGAIYNAGPGLISGGILRSNTAQSYGGAILNDSTTLTVTNATLQDNTTAGTGAGIANRATLTNSRLSLVATDVVSNVAAINGGGIYNSASGGLTAQVTIDGSRISANRANSAVVNEGLGGGILNGWGLVLSGGVAHMSVRQSSIIDNVGRMGGGIANIDATGYPTRSAQITILQSTLARNIAMGAGSQGGVGGGLYNRNGDAAVVNSTLSGNLALGDDSTQGGRGGGIGNVSNGITTTLHLRNATIAFNQASQAGGGVSVMRQVAPAAATMDSGNTLIVSNQLTVTQSITTATLLASMASPQVIAGTESCVIENGASNTLGGNIDDHTTCGFNLATDLKNTNVPLGPLANNGGPTDTHLITSDGPAFNNAVDAICAAAPVSAVDQRGVVRPQGPHCDRGAVELDNVVPPVLYLIQLYLNFIFTAASD